jgi:hypothetical protein
MVTRSPSTRFRAPQLRPGPSFAQARERMQAGALLRLEYSRGAPIWELEGKAVSPEIVSLLISCRDVEPDNDSLFDGAAAQTWKIRR